MKNLFLHTFLAAALLTGTSLCRQAQAQTLDFGSNSGSSNPSNFEQLAKEDAGKPAPNGRLVRRPARFQMLTAKPKPP